MENKRFSIKDRIYSFKYAGRGVVRLVSREHDAWIHCAVTVCVIVAGGLLGLSTFEWIAVILCIGAVTTLGVSYLLKFTVKKDRPDHSNRYSFPSAHTSLLFANAAFVQRRYGWKWGAPAYVLASYVGWSRVYGRKHDWWDVAAGAVIGAGCAYIYTRPFAQNHRLVISPLTDGNSFGVYASMTF